MKLYYYRLLLGIWLSFITVTTVAQTPPQEHFADLWAKVDSLEKKKLPRSAQDVVLEIYNRAKEQGLPLQQIKALLHRLKYIQPTEEKADSIQIALLRQEISSMQAPGKQILQSMLADLYWQIYRGDRYRILQRTELETPTEDFKTWSAGQFHQTITALYRESLQAADLLQQTPIRKVNTLLSTAEKSPEYRPTLFDLLAHRALDYFTNTESGLTEPGDKFELDAEKHMVNADRFITLGFETSDTLSKDLKTLQLFQQLLAFHKKNNQTVPFLDVELKRLNFLKQHIQADEATEAYVSLLEELTKDYSEYPIVSEAHYNLASHYLSQGNQYDVNDPEQSHRWDKKKAVEICDFTIEKYPKSKGAASCRILREQIIQPSINCTVEETIYPQSPGLMLLSWQNVEQVNFRIVAITAELKAIRDREAYRTAILDKDRIIESWSQLIKNEGDFQTHTSEIAIESLPAGEYGLIAANSMAFSPKNDEIEMVSFHVSRIAYFQRSIQEKGTREIFIRDRETGKPLKGVSVKPYKWSYRDKLLQPATQSYTSDKKGYVSFKPDPNWQYMEVLLNYKGDTLRTNRTYVGNLRERPYIPPNRTSVFFFTDRKIYRPGQTIYFKVIALSQKDRKYEIKTNHKLTVSFFDVNSQKIKDLEITTNDFGTAHGSFVAPQTGLLGNMTLRTDGGSVDFSVEEYKRPKFEVAFDPVEGNYQLGEEVMVTGKAQAYAGANIDGATVNYRVVRQASFPYWRGYEFGFWRPYPVSPSREIISGSTSTDAEGKFSLTFEALPDNNIGKNHKPVFSFTVYADVVDITGETHDASTYIRAAYTSLDLGLSAPNEFYLGKKSEISLSSNNLSGKAVKTEAKLSLKYLQAPDRVFRNRKWAVPDKPVLSKEEFRALFPYESYDQSETEAARWPEKIIKSENISLEGASSFDLGPWLTSAKAGTYQIELTAIDPSGDTLKKQQIFTVLDTESKKPAVPAIMDVRQDKTSAEPGEQVTFTVKTFEKKVWVLYELYLKNEVLDRQYLKVRAKKPQMVVVPIKEEYRGNVNVSFTLIRHNSFQQVQKGITIPWSNKQLQLSWSTFRSKLLPGQEEQWKLKISGPKSEAVAAELVATLYDASLDVFRSNSFYLSLYGSNYSRFYWEGNDGFNTPNSNSLDDRRGRRFPYPAPRQYDQLNWFGFAFLNYYGRPGMPMPRRARSGLVAAAPAMEMEESAALSYSADAAGEGGLFMDADGVEGDLRNKNANEPMPPSPDDDAQAESQAAPIRTNLNETAFFFPQLQTNEEGEIILSFTMPEALTRWKFLGLAHTKDLKTGTIGGETVTQKDLMVFPNVPRFFREGDKMTFTAKVSNLAENALSGEAELRLLDAFTLQSVAADFKLDESRQNFSVEAGQSARLSWEISVPEQVQAVVVQVYAKGGEFTDGEEHIIPVLKNRMMVTESLPLAIRGNSSKEYTFDKLIASDTSTSLKHQKLTLEFSSNPAWYAVQALPYLMEYPHDCTEQIFSRFYANALASHIANESPNVQRVFEQWRKTGSELTEQSLLSNLEKNQELKSVLLEETPWVLNARSEQERKQRIGLLFDINRMSNELSRAQRQLVERQHNNGSFSWFPGMPDSRYITQLIATGLGHLQHLGVQVASGNPEVSRMIQPVLNYLDGQIAEDLNRLKRFKRDLEKDNLSYTQIQYLYMRSFFTEIPVSQIGQEAYTYYLEQAKQYWTSKGLYMQGMLSLVFHRGGDQRMAKEIIASLKENAVYNDELGMYWKEITGGWYWYQAPIERQALLVEAFEEAGQDQKSVEELKIWLLKNKQTNDWKTTRATVAAVNALLSSGTNWLNSTALVDISLGDQKIDPKKREDVAVEAGTGYFKTAWTKNEIKPEMGKVSLNKSDEGIAWGALYWQYFEQLDKITYAETPLKLKKQLFLQENTTAGPQLKALENGTTLKAGDRVKVRVELRVDRDMEYVHMKDMRAAAFEPTEVLSSYRYQAGLSYYQSTKDAATHFFFEYLPKGTHVFEYTLIATQQGDFSNGVATIQCMYAPEFTSHSEGIRVTIE